MKSMKLVLAANWYGKSPWWSSLSFIFFWGGGWPKIYFGREQAQEQNSDALQRRGGIYNHLQAYLGANKHMLKSLKVTSAAPHPHLGRAFQTQGQSPANVDTCPERILRMAGENWQTGFTTAKCGSSRLNQSKQPFPTKGIFLPNSARWEVPFHVFSIQQPHYQVPESSQTIRHQPTTRGWISAKIILSFWQSKLEVSPAGCLIHPLGSTFPLPKHSK